MNQQENVDLLLKKLEPIFDVIPEPSPIRKMAGVFIDKIKEEIRLAATNPAYPSHENQRRIAIEFKISLFKFINEKMQIMIHARQQIQENEREQQTKKDKLLYYLQEEERFYQDTIERDKQLENKNILAHMEVNQKIIQYLEKTLEKLQEQLKTLHTVKKHIAEQIIDLKQKINNEIINLYHPERMTEKSSLALTIPSTNETIHFNIDGSATLLRLKEKIKTGLSSGEIDHSNYQQFENKEIVQITKEHFIKAFTNKHPSMDKNERNKLINETIYTSSAKNEFSEQFTTQVDSVFKMIADHKALHQNSHNSIKLLTTELSEKIISLNKIETLENSLITSIENTNIRIYDYKTNPEARKIENEHLQPEGLSPEAELDESLDHGFDDFMDTFKFSSEIDKAVEAADKFNSAPLANQPELDGPELEEAELPHMRPR